VLGAIAIIEKIHRPHASPTNSINNKTIPCKLMKQDSSTSLNARNNNDAKKKNCLNCGGPSHVAHECLKTRGPHIAHATALINSEFGK